VNDFLCPIPPPKPEGKSFGALPKNVPSSQRDSQEQPQDLHVADFVVAYVLGDGPEGRVIEQFAGQTGYHIRTIPSSRFTNPIAVGAGAGYLVVVDRFGAEDLIRVTDKYGGAGAGAFDDDGFPSDSIDWGAVADIRAISTGGRVSGIQVLPRGVLIACVNMGTGVPTFVKYDLVESYAPYNGIFTLPEPYDALGDAVGVPCLVDQTRGEWAHEFLVAIRNDANGSILAKVDFLQEKVTGLIGLPAGQPYGVVNTGGIMSVLMGDETRVTSTFRLERLDNSSFMPGLYSDLYVPQANGSTAISETFSPLDLPGVAPSNYYDFSNALNRRFGSPFAPGEETSPYSAINDGGRAIPATTTGAKNDNRTPTASSYDTAAYGPIYTVPAQEIQNPAGAGIPDIKGVDVVHNTVAELTFYASGSQADPQKPLYRLLHGTHFDYLSDGGFTYGCRSESDDTVVPVTSGLFPVSVAIDKSSEPGRLKELPDLKVALVDQKTGLMVYGSTKPLGFRWYGGLMAGVRLTDVAQERVRRTPCSDEVETNFKLFDGIKYTQDAAGRVSEITRDDDYQISFATANDGRRPWNLFIPRVTPGTPSVQPYDSRPVRTMDGDGAFLDWWLSPSVRANPATTIGERSRMFYPKRTPNTNDPTFATSVRAGFFGLNWRKERVDGEDESVTFVTPDSVLDYELGPLDRTPAYEADTPEEAETGLSTDPPLAAFTVDDGLGELPDLTRAVIFDTDIRSWLGFEVKLDRTAVFSDGAANWTQPDAYENGLGIPVGITPNLFSSYCYSVSLGRGAAWANAYDYGDTAGDGAAGVWQIDLLANGRPINSVATKVTFAEQLTMAPEEAQELLQATMQASGGVDPGVGYHKGKVYFSSEVVTSITIRARLVNYAFGVYRIGWHTLSYDHNDFIGDGPSLCPGADPGFYAGNNCEASCCGNVACLSQVQFGNKLFASDPTRPVVINTVWEGAVTFKIPTANNPYQALGLGVGTIIDGYLEFNLNGPMSGWNVNLRSGGGSS